MSLSSDQRADMQGDLGISADETVFTNDELDRLYERAHSDYNTAVYLGYRQIMANAAKLHNYTAGQTRIDKAQVFDHLKSMVEFWQGESRTASNQVKVLGINSVPPRHKRKPDTAYSRRNRPYKDWNGWS